MSLLTILGQKKEQSQKFLKDGTRIPVTRVWVKGNTVVTVKTNDKDHYSAIQLGFGEKKKASKAIMGHIKGANLLKAPKFLKEVRIEDSLELGTVINAIEVLKEGDMVDVTATSKGKGYAGVVKRHHFKGGPRTHGQSDRERAPGSIGQTTTPGRVYKGKRMAGRMGHETVTIKNLQVVGVTEDEILIKGLVPGSVNTMVIVKKVGENKKFVPLFREKESTEQLAHAEGDAQDEATGIGQPQISEDAQPVDEKTEVKDSASLSEIRATESGEEQDDSTKSDFGSSETGLSDSSKEQSEENKDEVKENAG